LHSDRPKDNDSYVKRAPKSPKDTKFHYDVSFQTGSQFLGRTRYRPGQTD
jgi:hypothetical protein